MTGSDDGFLGRWSRRKRAVAREEAEAEDVAPAPDTAPDEAPDAEPEPAGPERSDAEILEMLGLKDPDLLKKGDAFAPYMQAAVPDHLRRRALRRLWRSNPVLANLDGLNDYDTDFTGGGVAPGMLKTAYKVGRGFLRDAPEVADGTGESEVAVADASDEPAEAAATGAGDAAAVSEETPADGGTDDTAEPPEEHETGKKRHEPQDYAYAPPRRRMRFHFND
ncbi:DUF3306 domain-containing protein [Roseivivax isoporae]|uniref:DUF3306 domain-containing protein n=1 Tax=Roseivivax isoporae LMG 25204 TaxID=1449351 RepID=X7FBV7_9RHOB|nr:DUF3306 domain-containing protein [Roseivivax isoporae]ETX30305.1 hypothetical protein RISW2_15835 [Roseivivax isoporae LMG 25204]